MQRFFSGNISRRQAMAGAGACAVGMASPSPLRADTPPQGSPSKMEYKPEQEWASFTQNFSLNFNESDGSSDVAARLSNTLKRIGHTYNANDLSAIAHAIVSSENGELLYEDSSLRIRWFRPAEGHLQVHANLHVMQLVADLPSGWKLNLLG